MVSESSSNLNIFLQLPHWVAGLLACLAALAWWRVHLGAYRPGSLFRGKRAIIAGIPIGMATIVAALHALQFKLVYTTSWPLWMPALLGAAAIEACLAIYKLERDNVRQGNTRRLLSGLRIALVLLIALMLAQPVIVTERTRNLDRYIAVIFDATPSMAIADSRMSEVERLRMAEALGYPGSLRPYRLDGAADTIRKAAARIAAQSEWLQSLQALPEDDRAEQLERERNRLHVFFRDQEKLLREALGKLGDARELSSEIEDAPVEELAGLESRLDRDVVNPLKRLAESSKPESMPARWIRFFRERAGRSEQHEATGAADAPHQADEHSPAGTNAVEIAEIAMSSIYEDIRDTLSATVETLISIVPPLQAAGYRMDRAFYMQLEPEDRESVDRVARRTREDIALDLLLGIPDAEDDDVKSGFLERIRKDIGVQVYRMAAGTEQIDINQWREQWATNRLADGIPVAAANPDADTEGNPDAEDIDDADRDEAARIAWRERLARESKLIDRGRLTDLHAALEHIARDIPGEQLEALIVISDARHNAPSLAEQAAARFGRVGIPVHTVLFGSTNSPIDAAIVDVDAPDTILAGDRARFWVDVRLDGITNRTVALRLFEGTELLDTKKLETQGEDIRERVEFIDNPERVGMHNYRFELDFDEDEAVATNNHYQVSVNVSEEPAHLLLIDGPPSWEFRYLKNLFSGRDPWTRLQYVLLEQRMIPDEPERERTPASVSRSGRQIEANAMPESLEEWLKFDVIIIGDAAPEHFSNEDMAALSVFVRERGGSLIVMAGPNSMPHAYPPGELRDLLPVHALSTDRALIMGPEREYRIHLSRDGEADPMMRLSTDPAENQEIWNAMPELYWRQPAVAVRDGATVLAYAAGVDLPEYMLRPPTDLQTLSRQREYERSRALISHHHAGLGNVLYFGFNHTWRLRYRTGDTFHHRLWGQIMRWATAYKMPFGTDNIRMGTGQARYGPDESVVVRARLLKHDHSPYVVDNVNAVFMRDEKLVMRREMSYINGSPGVYEVEVPGFEEGNYEVRLEAPVDEELIKEFNDIIAEAPPSFSVAADISPEWRDLTADPGLAGRLAALSGGRLIEPREIDAIRAELGPATVTHTDREQWDIWNSWPLLIIMALLLGTEWILRKRERLP